MPGEPRSSWLSSAHAEATMGSSLEVTCLPGVIMSSIDHDRKPFDDLFPKAGNFTFGHGGWQFVGLDSTDGTQAKVAVRADTLKWLDQAVTKLDKKQPLVLFTHMPLGPWVVYRATNAD